MIASCVQWRSYALNGVTFDRTASTREISECRDEIKLGKATSRALRTPCPSELTGRVSCLYEKSENNTLVIIEKLSGADSSNLISELTRR